MKTDTQLQYELREKLGQVCRHINLDIINPMLNQTNLNINYQVENVLWHRFYLPEYELIKHQAYDAPFTSTREL